MVNHYITFGAGGIYCHDIRALSIIVATQSLPTADIIALIKD